MKKLFAIAFAAIIILALPSFTNNKTEGTEIPLSVKVLKLHTSEVGYTMNNLAGHAQTFIPSTCIATNELQSILNEATKLGSGVIRLSIVQGKTGSNYLVANYLQPGMNNNNIGIALDSPFYETADALTHFDSLPKPCTPKCDINVNGYVVTTPPLK